jgi:CPA2 family monovalent cation:H+ antiporter-2
MSLAQIGEFSFIIAGVGLATGATRPFLYPVAVSVSASTTLSTPWLIRLAGPTASWVDRRLPRPVQNLVSLYGSWMEQLRAPSQGRSRGRVQVGLLLLDIAVLALPLAASPCVIGLVRLTRALSIAFWRGASNLAGHTRADAEA